MLCPFLLSSFPLVCVSPESPFSINRMLLNPYFQLCFWETPPETRREPCNPRGIMSRTLIISRIAGGRGVTEEEVTRVGRKAQRRLPTQAPLEFTCGEKCVPGLGAGDSLWVWGALQSSRAGAGPQERLAGARTEGLGCPLIVWTLQQGNDTYRSVSKKKMPLLPLLRVGGGPGRRYLQHSTTRLTGMGRGIGWEQGVTPRGLQDRELTGLGSCCADYGWGEDSRRCQADKMSASASGQGWVTTCGQVWGEWRM